MKIFDKKKKRDPEIDLSAAAQRGTGGYRELEDRDERRPGQVVRKGELKRQKGRSSSVSVSSVLRMQLVALLALQAFLLGVLGVVLYSIVVAFIG